MRRIFYASLIVFVFTVDRLLKIWVSLDFQTGESFPVWPGVFHLTLVNNAGAAFGLWKDSGAFLTVFSAVSFLIIAAYLFKKPGRPHASAWSLIAGGALGNLADRVAYGHVIDYLDLRVWPVFNFADACICLGVIWIVFRFVAYPPKAPHASDPF